MIKSILTFKSVEYIQLESSQFPYVLCYKLLILTFNC